MSHSIIAVLERGGTIRWEARCTAPEGAKCRLDCPEGCESWNVEHDEQGYFHMTSPFDSLDGSPAARHDLVDSGQCNTCDWLNADPSLMPELYNGRYMVLASIPITTRWEGSEEGVTWKPKGQLDTRWVGDDTGPDAWMGDPR